MIHRCNCRHLDQDKIHGLGMRAHNICNKGAKIRCTVCKNEKDNPNKKVDTVKEKK